MTISKAADMTPAYTDLAGLSALKRGAAKQDPAAVRKVAEQFESMFTRMVLKSMRDAVGKDPMFSSDQEDMYQSMADDQLSVQLSKGKGLGLADMLIRQLQKMGVKGAGGASDPGGSGSAAIKGLPSAGPYSITRGASGSAAYKLTQQSGLPATEADKDNFVREMWPHAQAAAQQLGVAPGSLIAQAALETNWGRSQPQDAAGRGSNNLFGIKAAGDWNGATVTTGTKEFQGAAATNITAPFRAYASRAESFQDYVALLRDNPRYAAALNTGGDVQAFATALQRGGYATDPEYASKIRAISHRVHGALDDLKLSDALPLHAKTGTL